MDGWEGAPIDPAVLVIGATLALSFLGLPRLRRPAGGPRRESLRTKWVYFEFSHPFLAATLIWTVAALAATVLAREAWVWRHDVVASFHGALAFVTGGRPGP